MKMTSYKLLMIEAHDDVRKETKKELMARGLSVVDTTNLEEGLNILRSDGAIQAVMVNWKMYSSKQSKVYDLIGEEIFYAIIKVRYEVNLFLYTIEKDWRALGGKGLISGYFYKGDKDYDDIYRRIVAEVADKSAAPFFDRLVEYAKESNDSWHTPGHSSGDSFKNSIWVKDFYSFYGHNLFASDVSVSVPSLDSLLDPKPNGVVTASQELAARAFRANHTYFVTNGTSTANKILLQTLLKPGDAILLDRNCHKSVHYGVIAAGAEPIYMMPSVNNEYGIFGPIAKKHMIETMDSALAAGKKVKALIVTNCTYDGLIYDIEFVVREAHARNIKVIVDEAWFGYANFHPFFYPSAMAAGADYATQSTHKVLSALSQASMIHVNDPEFDSFENFFMENYLMYTSTSPSYPVLASLDIARKQMVMEGYSLLTQALELAEDLRNGVNSLPNYKTLELDNLLATEVQKDGIRLDRTKVTIDISHSGFTNREIEHVLNVEYGIQIEKSTFNTITVLITIGTTRSKVNRLFLALESLSRRKQADAKQHEADAIEMFLSPIHYLPRAAFYCDGESVHIRKAVDRIATGMIVPYPPGIPILVPGQIVTQEIIDYLLLLYEKGVEIHGMEEGNIQVATRDEEMLMESRGTKLIN